MAFRIHLIAFHKAPADRVKANVLKLFPETEEERFADPEVFSSNDRWTCLCVSTHSAKREQFESFVAETAGPAVWITTNNPDDWIVRVGNGANELVALHLPLVNVDPDERQEADGEEVLQSLEIAPPPDLANEMAPLDGSEAWDRYFKHARSALESALTDAGIPFDSSRLHQLFSEEAFDEMDENDGAQLGYFVNEVLEIGFDLSEDDDRR